jgi:integrase
VKFWTHCARHTHATHAYAITKDPKFIENTLGHCNVSTTLSLYVDETAGDSSSKYLE